MSLDRELLEDEGNLDGDPDDKLASAAKGGDREARNTLYMRHFPSIYPMLAPANRLLATVSGTDNSIEPQDVVQHSFLIFCNLLESWHGNSQEEPFLSYLVRHIPSHASHYVRDTLHYRAIRRVVSYPGQQPLESAAGVVGHEAEFVNPLDAEVQSNISWAEHTRNLTQQSNRWITLRYSLGLTTAQIADLCGVSPRTVHRHLKAALTKMRQQLQSTWENCA